MRQIPGYLQHADVLVVPHVVSAFTESLDPIKAYECLAVGTPTVATPVAGFRNVGGPVHIAEPADFVDTVRAVLDEKPDPRPQQAPSWTERADQFGGVLDAASTAKAATPPKTKVVYYDHCAELSGGELALARLLPAMVDIDPLVILGEHGPLEEVLAERGMPSEVLSLDEDLARTNRYDAAGSLTKLHTVVSVLNGVRRLRRRFRELEPDLIHTNSLKAALIGGAAGRLAGAPVVWHIRDRMSDDYLPNAAIKLVQAASRVLPTAIITNSETTKAALGRPGATVIASPVEVNENALATLDRHPADPLRVVMVGRTAPWKGQDVFLRAFARAFPSGPERALIAGAALFGEDEFANSLPALAKELAIDDRVDFLGFVDDVPTLLADCDILVHASVISEPFGQVVVEGMAAGLPVIATDLGGPSEVITHGETGLLTTAAEVDILASELARLADDPSERRRLGDAARVRARDFTPDRIAEQVADVYRATLGGSSR